MKIQQLAEKTGLTVYTLLFYEKEGLLNSRHVLREENNYRSWFVHNNKGFNFFNQDL